jgi:hypothetical protein
MSVQRESIITILRSTVTDTPTGLTYGELAYSDLNGKLFVGKNDGTSLWVGAGITSGPIGTSEDMVPTHSAVKTYVEGVVGGGSVVNTLNATGGAVTVTGDNGAIRNAQVGKNNTIVARLATSSLTGVAYFPTTDFGVVAGAVSLTGNVARTNVAQTFTATQIFNAGLSGNLTGNATSASNASSLGGTAANSWALKSWVTTELGDKAETDGSNATGTWPINITGNAATATTATNASSLGGTAANSWALQSWVTTGLGTKADTDGSNATGTWPISITGNAGTASKVANALTVGTGLGGGSSYDGSAALTISNTGVLSLNGLTGARTLTGDAGAVVGRNNDKISVRLATSSLTGVAYFPTADFGVVAGAVSLTGNVARTNVAQTFTATQIFNAGLSGNLTGNATSASNASSLGGTAANSWALKSWVTTGLGTKADTDGSNATGTWPINITGNAATATTATTASSASQVANALTIGTGLGGGASYNGSSAVTISNTGVLSLNGLTGARTLTGDGGAIVGVGNSTIGARLATTSGATGVASFDGDNFSITNGVVSIKNGGITNAELAASSITLKDSSGDAGQSVSLGTSFTIQGTTNEITTSRSGSTITVGLPDDVVISGNLTVNGTVVTNNVDTFIVEDPLIVLGTGNSTDAVDLGFYAKYSGNTYTGLFRDSDDKKFKLFSGLTVEPTTTVNTGGAGYGVATLVARIDGGTF